jgi:ATP-dependent 26S proteasome regulatory subunit
MRDSTSEDNLSLEHLQAELERIDVLIRREIRRWQLAGQDPSDRFRGLYLSDHQAEALSARPFATSWGQTVTLPKNERRAFAKAEAQAVARAAASARQAGKPTRLAHLASAFSLDRFDLDALLICLAPALDLRYGHVYGYLQDDVTRKAPSVNLVLELLSVPGPERLTRLARFADDAPLFKHHLLRREAKSAQADTPLLSQALRPDTAIVTWLLGKYQPPAELTPHARLLAPEDSAQDRLLAADAWPTLQRTVVQRPVVVFTGPDGAAQQAAARLVAVQSQRPLLHVSLGSVNAGGPPPRSILALALRDARLVGAIPVLSEWDACLAEGAAPPDLLDELCRYPDVAIVAGQAPWRAHGTDRERTFLWVEFPFPAFSQRVNLWQHFVSQAEPKTTVDVAELAGQFVLTADQIRDAVATARDMASQRGDTIQGTDLFAAARTHSNPRLSALARKIVARYSWQDIVLPDDQITLLREIVATIRGRPKVLEEWGVVRKLASSAGVTVLFAGPPGTGKTMAAEVIASELGLDLYKIDLSTVVSKYIGETEKNLERIFGEAQNSNAILFFDEADAIFGKRSEVKDAHDRYANIEISYLLQRMEAYDGVTILATNLRANLDEAFTRRLQFAVDFPFPEEEYRLRIWQTLFPSTVPRTDDLDFALLAHRFKLAGGSIRNVIVNAAFLAAAEGEPVAMRHLLHATRRELQKMGRLVSEADMATG